MKYITVFISILIIVIFAAVIVKQRIGDIRPAMLPASKNFTQSFSQNTGDSPSFPLQVSGGFKVGVFAEGLGGARGLTLSPGGTVVSSIMGKGEIVALPDKDSNGKADSVKVLITGLSRPHGIAFYNDKLYVTEETKVSRYNWDETNLTATLDKKILDLPAGGNHFTRTIVFDKTGNMYVSLGSTCNVCIEKNPWIATVITASAEGENPRVFSKGLRNAVAMETNPDTGEVWVADNGRDNLGDNLPPEEIDILKDGADFGWPFCYGNKIVDKSFDASTTAARCQNTVAPAFEMQAHSAPLGLTFINSNQFPSDWQGDLLATFHGSWNRSVPTGYKVVHLNVENGKVTSQEDFLTGFVQGSDAAARPVDLLFDQAGSLYVSDDKGGFIFKVIKG